MPDLYTRSMAKHNPLLIAHRGDSKNHAENTMEAFASAFEKGADGIELDIHERDGELIVVHNYNYDPSGVFPTLPQVLQEFAGKGRLEIEVKTIGLRILDPLEAALKDYRDHDIELTTSVSGLLAFMRPKFPQYKLGCILLDREFEPWMYEERDFYVRKAREMMALYEADIVHLPFQACTNLMIESLHSDGKLVHTNLAGQTPERQKEMYAAAQSLGVDQLTFDFMGLCSV